jgi:outer membrane lipopolysaccharide assembly protein LptE/RlpB
MRPLLLIILALALAGCAGYKLGSTNGLPAGSRSVKVNPFANRTHEPRVTEYLGASLRRQLQQDGTFRLETSDGGDILLTGEIIRFDRTGLSYQTNDVLTPQESTLTLVAHIVARESHSGKVDLDRNVQGRTYIRLGNDQSSAEREAIPMLTDDLARNAISLLVDGNW